MKAIMLSIQPRHCENICTVVGNEKGKPIYKKTIEVRKKAPKCDTPFKCYIYCTKGEEHLITIFHKGEKVFSDDDNSPTFDKTIFVKNPPFLYNPLWRQKVIGEFVCDRIDTYYYGNMDYPTPAFDGDESVCEIGDGYYITSGELEKTCLHYEELEKYGKGKTLYGWHISDLKIYDTPKELGDFKYPCPQKYAHEYDCSCGIKECKYKVPGRVPFECAAELTRPPQSWVYVEEL